MIRWVADPRVVWRILLSAELAGPAGLAEPLPTDVLAERLAALYDDQGWGRAPEPVVAAEVADLRAALTARAPEPLTVGRAGGRTLVVSAHHSAVDGLGLLEVLAALLDSPVSSSARGVGDRRTTGGVARTTSRRLAEVAFRPPARLAPPAPPVTPHPGEVTVTRSVAGRWRTADLVHAGALAAADRAGPRVAVAVGATRDAVRRPLADRSVLLRLRDVERLDRDRVAELLRSAPVQTPPTPGHGPHRLADAAVATGLRVLAPRLGSTLLVSHLGRVTAPAVRELAFHPVTGGGSGVALGAVGIDDPSGPRTVLGLRARGTTWDADGLEQLLEAVVERL